MPSTKQAAMLLEGTDRLVELRVEQLAGDVTARRQAFFLSVSSILWPSAQPGSR